MQFRVNGNGVWKFFGILMIGATLAGCGSPGDSSSGSATSGSTTSSSQTPVVALSSSLYMAAPSSSAIVTIYRDGPATGSVAVNYTTVNGSANAGSDYTPTTGAINWSDGDTSPKTVLVPVAASATGKTFAISLTNVQGNARIGMPAAATIRVLAAGVSSGSSGGSGTNSVTLSWLAPTENTDGSALTNLAGYNIYYGASLSALTNKVSIPTVGMLTYVIGELSSGNWYFALTSINSAGTESSLSSTVQTTL